MKIRQTGVVHHDKKKATPEFTLFSPSWTDQVCLVNMDGELVHDWTISMPGLSFCYLRPNGNLFVSERMSEGPKLTAGKGGRMREYDWDGNVVWELIDIDQHHDARRLDNGNVAYIAWELLDKSAQDRIIGGMPGSEEKETGGIYGDVIRETTPEGEVLFEWHSTDLDYQKYKICPLCTREEYGHANTIAPLPGGNYLVSFRVLNLLVIIDRQTGKLNWEFHDYYLGHQHDCHMIENGNILVYANGFHTNQNSFSSVWEIDPDSKETVWTYRADPNPLTFFSPHISGAQRLSSGNTLICEGGHGCIFEVTPEGEIVWEYINPYDGDHPMFNKMNWVFRAKRYAADSPEIRNRV